MEKEALVAAARKMVAAPSCYAGLKAAGEAWIAAVGTEQEAGAAKALKVQLDDCVGDIDGFIAFAGSPTGEQVLGGHEAAQGVVAAAKKAKAAGTKYCICDACTNGGVLLDHEADWLK